MNPVTLFRLEHSGSDLSRPHEIVNVFQAPDDNRRESLATDLTKAGFSAADEASIRSAASAGWLESTLLLVPTLDSINTMTDQCVAIAMRHGAVYDGWYTEVVTEDGTL